MNAGTHRAASAGAGVFAPAPDTERHDEMVRALVCGRQNVSPKRLVEPGPTAAQLERMLELAAAAPDHGLLLPWRFVVVPQAKRVLLAEVFALALIDRDAGATPAQIEAAREKAHRAPLLMLAIVRLGTQPQDITDAERLVSLGAALQNVLLGAHALGFGSGLVSGRAIGSPRLRKLFALQEDEQPVCFVNVGTTARPKLPRVRPASSLFCSVL